MKNTLYHRILSALLALVFVLCLFPACALPVFAGHFCPDCQDWIDGSPYCQDCYKCNDCVDLCIECGSCTDCTGNDICDGCSNEEIGDTVCEPCAVERGSHCPDCEECYYVSQLWCEECGACDNCVGICRPCSENLGNGILCVNCAAEGEGHCPGCGGCYFEIQGWCEECMLCAECVSICEYCSAEAGAILCENCAIDEGMHCPDCTECYGEVNGDLCQECGICLGCVDICATHELCVECAIDAGYHCPNCEACGEEEILCEDCGERCTACVDEFCENCNMCGECVQLCPDCGACSNCAEICENCEEHCSECEGLCDDCGLCLACCEDNANFEGCDCSDWVCKESSDWDDHFTEKHLVHETGHNPRPVATWAWDDTHHWRQCRYCDDSDHYTYVGEHTFSGSVCTDCGYVQNGKIQIIQQPQDAYNVYVQSPYEIHDERNIAHFSVKAVGESELTYTWYMGYEVNGQIKYFLLTEPSAGECFDGPDLYVLAYTDGCYSASYIYCIITDEEGNEVRTVDARMHTRHDYHYYKCWKDQERPYETAERNQHGHILQCVGEGCEQRTGLRPHFDEDRDDYCDECGYDMPEILITKQPKNVRDVYVYGPLEDYDEKSIAHFSVEAEGNSELTYTWCRRTYSGGKLVYEPLKNPQELECYDGPDLALLVPTDACCQEYRYCCFITDEEGNEVRTIDVTLKAKHHYQYFKDYLSGCENPYESVRRFPNGHILQCVGEGCEKKTPMQRHMEENNDYICDVCGYRSLIDFAELTVTPPKEGQTPDYGVVCGSVAYYAVGKMNNGRYWFVSDNGVDNWKLMDNTTPFVADKYYKFSVDLHTANGYEFSRHKNYNSKVLVQVNGGTKFFAEKCHDQDLAHYVTVEYEFGICNDSVIENIVIDGVTQPVAGQKPTYTAVVRGSGYYIDSSKNAQLDDYWNNPQQKPHYIKNGIGWFDLTESDWVYENETFIPGHQYQAKVYIRTEDGYTFWHDKWNSMLFTASINGFGAEGNTTGSSGLTEQTISASFLCQPQEVTSIAVRGLDAPQAGKTPDYTLISAEPDLYQPDANYAGSGGIVWYDSEDQMLEPTDTFEEGKHYWVEIKVVPTQLEGANVCKFASPVSAYLNGKQVVTNDAGDIVYGNDNAVYIYYHFPDAAASAYVPGDVNEDGKVNIKDLGLVQQHLNGWDVVLNTDAADVNRDGKVNIKDLGLIQQYLNGWDVELK